MNTLIKGVAMLALPSFRIINKLTRKDPNMVSFFSTPDFSDNALSIFLVLASQKPELSFIWHTESAFSVTPAQDYIEQNLGNQALSRIKFLRYKSVKSVLYALKSGAVIYTHKSYPFCGAARTQKVLNTWHGMSLKKGGATVVKSYKPYKKRPYVSLLATSSFFVPALSRTFAVPQSRFFVTGFPRNDWLFKKTTGALSTLGIDKTCYSKVIIWMPTYRASFETWADNKAENSKITNELPFFSPEGLSQLSQMLVAQESLLLVKLHPLDILNDKVSQLPALPGINILTKDDFVSPIVPLYALLAETHALISDFSSVLYDYLLLDRPMAIAVTPTERAQYERLRGFHYDEATLEKILPAPRLTSEAELCSFILSICEGKDDELLKSQRKEAAALLHCSLDAHSSERAARALGLL